MGTVPEALFGGPEASLSAGFGRSWPQPRLRGILGYSLHLSGDPGIQSRREAPHNPHPPFQTLGAQASGNGDFPSPLTHLLRGRRPPAGFRPNYKAHNP